MLEGAILRSDLSGTGAGIMADHDDCTAEAQRRVWPDIVHALSGREVHGDALELRLRQADIAASLLLQDTESLSGATPLAGDAATPQLTPGLRATAEGCARSRCPQEERVAAVHGALAWAAKHALGSGGSACCQYLSARAEWQCAWLGVQKRVAQALRAAGCAPAAGLSLLPLWSCLKGIPGLRSPSPEVRIAAVQLLQEAFLALNSAPPNATAPTEPSEGGAASDGDAAGDANGAGKSQEAAAAASRADAAAAVGVAVAEAEAAVMESAAGGDAELCTAMPAVADAAATAPALAAVGGVSAWTVCRELACGMAAKDTDPRVVAAALRATAALLALCREQCGEREWRQLAEGVLLAAGRGREDEASGDEGGNHAGGEA
ncbi:hypothetical protein PLESTM_001475600 [Pleodorina starrii]|nr:hypothetical protein PLESTM_001475600 [Pleodorina starrii]